MYGHNTCGCVLSILSSAETQPWLLSTAAEQKCRESTGKYHFRSENWRSVLMSQRVILLLRMVWTNLAQGVPVAMENIHAAKLLRSFSSAESGWCGLVQFDIGVRRLYSPQMMIN